MSDKHTPAPWFISQEENWNTRSDKKTVICSKNTSICYVFAGRDLDNKLIPNKANARLIAAAPELLESLETILANFKSCISGGNGELETDAADIEKAEQAINKAKGL